MAFSGGAELAETLSQMAPGASRKVRLDALRKAAEPMRSNAQRNAPRDPGAPDLADNIGISPVQGNGGRDPETDVAVKVGPTKDYFYGYFQEFGTRRHGAQPFMRPAFHAGVSPALGILRDELWKALRSQAPSASAGSRLL